MSDTTKTLTELTDAELDAVAAGAKPSNPGFGIFDTAAEASGIEFSGTSGTDNAMRRVITHPLTGTRFCC